MATHLAAASQSLKLVLAGCCGLLAAVALLGGLRYWLLARRLVATGVTWDCGYAAPSARMQYTASSFAEPLTTLFGFLLQTQRRWRAPAGFFPVDAELTCETPDLCSERLYRPAFGAIGRALALARWLQHGRVQLYILYVALTLVLLLVWQLG